MVTLKLKKPLNPTETETTRPRLPVRNGVSGPRPRPTLAQAQAERARRAEEYGGQPVDPDRRRPPQRQDQDRPPMPRRDDQGRGFAPRRDDPPQRPAYRDERPARNEPQVRDDRRSGPPAERTPWYAPQSHQEAPAARARRVLEPARPVRPGTPSQRPARPAEVPSSPLAGEGERLSKRMAALGLASRREADEWIEAGWVRVDGKMAVLGQRVGPQAKIHVDPAAHKQQAQRVTILVNKPVGYVSGQAEDGYEPAAALIRPENRWSEDSSGVNWHPGQLRGLAPAGRLDIDSVGLLVLTQDGRVAKLLIGDESLVEKEYLVRVAYQGQGRLPDSALALLNHGLELDGQALRPAKVSWQNEDQLRFVLREGKKRQIRRMCEAVGLQVLGLKRVRIGSVSLGHLPAGQWRYLRRDEFFI
ncbi:RNA-binding S4 domain protein [Leptothrix cholodnii SP-6]|uniref:Dual-specificity RNA pseudouridine synthase RluF n=1 Tax=Leptothrix cholodnii (strain ATCC 51168 / LMG 8142 / SP-6) TaxID=395495 RepID=B1Y0S2_LEPCP|nr:RNA-binding S4 domain protein [Leptothrix cholodnii SP-6]